MKEITKYIPYYINDTKHRLLSMLDNILDWVKESPNRDEYFMALDHPLTYTYGDKHPRTYTSNIMQNHVYGIMMRLNEEFGTNYNVCFLNRYNTQKGWLGWHADDSTGMNLEHPIAVISLCEELNIDSQSLMKWLNTDFIFRRGKGCF